MSTTFIYFRTTKSLVSAERRVRSTRSVLGVHQFKTSDKNIEQNPRLSAPNPASIRTTRLEVKYQPRSTAAQTPYTWLETLAMQAGSLTPTGSSLQGEISSSTLKSAIPDWSFGISAARPLFQDLKIVFLADLVGRFRQPESPSSPSVRRVGNERPPVVRMERKSICGDLTITCSQDACLRPPTIVAADDTRAIIARQLRPLPRWDYSNWKRGKRDGRHPRTLRFSSALPSPSPQSAGRTRRRQVRAQCRMMARDDDIIAVEIGSQDEHYTCDIHTCGDSLVFQAKSSILLRTLFQISLLVPMEQRAVTELI
ncbi:hypothetical protein B0H10DRAFT_1948639 [Mycena sp. CBHHK59/15]|nr:hypothetical protein B0H10DRAFT_1948639 [Mycena sp. CBHHK59/15]